MKKAKKQCLGFFGLATVAAMTAIAVAMPAPETAAVSTSVTDTLTVRVIGGTPDVYIYNLTNEASYADPQHVLNVNYEHVSDLTVSISYVNEKTGETETWTVTEMQNIDQEADSITYTILDLIRNVDKYGKYTLTVSGTGFDGVSDEETIVFYWRPTSAEAVEDETTGDHGVELEYGEGVSKITVEVFNEAGEKVMKDQTIYPPDKYVSLPFEDYDLPSGTYTVKITTYDEEGNIIHEAYEIYVVYTALNTPNAGAPDTGGLFRDLNISKEDYLVSGLIIFFVLGIVAFGIVARGRKDSKRR